MGAVSKLMFFIAKKAKVLEISLEVVQGLIVYILFLAMFRRPFDFEEWENKWVNKLSEKRLLILRNIHENNKIKKSMMCKNRF